MLDAIFVVGTGRSGTHFTCRALAGFEHVTDPLNGRENGKVLYKIANAALCHQNYPSEAVTYYQKQKQQIGEGRVFLDQHHPNIFFTKELAAVFSNPVFLYPVRPVVQVVASMLQHQGVLSWYDLAKKGVVPFPNRFLGIESKAQLFEMDLHKLCALRVLAHHQRMKELAASHPSCRFIAYEGLINDQEAEFAKVFSNAERKALGDFNVVEESKAVSLDKYRSVLSDRQIDEIADLEHGWNGSRIFAAIG